MGARRDKDSEKRDSKVKALSDKISRKIRDRLGTFLCKILSKIRNRA